MIDTCMLVDLSLCIGCNSCSIVCNQANGIESGNRWLKVRKKEEVQQEILTYFYPQSCRHCFDPNCVKICPTGAVTKEINGVVLHQENKCIGCHVCYSVCTHGGINIMSNGKIGKCTFCFKRLNNGEEPACVSVCPSQARIFGSRESLIKEGLKRQKELSKNKILDFLLEGNNVNGSMNLYLIPTFSK